MTPRIVYYDYNDDNNNTDLGDDYAKENSDLLPGCPVKLNNKFKINYM